MQPSTVTRLYDSEKQPSFEGRAAQLRRGREVEPEVGTDVRAVGTYVQEGVAPEEVRDG